MRIGLTYDLQTDAGQLRQAEFDPPATIEALCRALESLGHDVIRFGTAHELLQLPEQLRAIDLVFNIAEGSHGRCREAWVPNLLELHGIPYVGSDQLALSLGLDKVACKRVAVASGIPTPRWIAIEHPHAIPQDLPLNFPVIVKPRYEGSGSGVDEGAVVHDRASLPRRIEWLWAQIPQDILIEEFAPAGELTVLVVGNDPPIAHPAIQRAIDPLSRLSCHVVKAPHTTWETPLVLTPELDAEARRIAVVMFEALGCHDMARVDLRVDEQGRPTFLEINPLPSFDPEGTFGLVAEYLGMTYAQMVGSLLEAARRRLAASTHTGIRR